MAALDILNDFETTNNGTQPVIADPPLREVELDEAFFAEAQEVNGVDAPLRDLDDQFVEEECFGEPDDLDRYPGEDESPLIQPVTPSEVFPLPAAACIAVDTEFEGPLTLTVQTAMRLDPETILVQVYRNPTIPLPPDDFDITTYIPTDPERYGRFCKRILFRPVKHLTQEFSPGMMLRDLLGRVDLQCVNRGLGIRLPQSGDPLGQPSEVSLYRNVLWNARTHSWTIPTLRIKVINHFSRADFGRMFGRTFLQDLKGDNFYAGKICVAARKLIQFVRPHCQGGHRAPVLEYLFERQTDGDRLYGLSLDFVDTCQPFGSASLDSLSRSFLGLGKSSTLGEDDKRSMLNTFRIRTDDAYGYAGVDTVNTLLVYEQMVAKDQEIKNAFGFDPSQRKPMRSTLGGRVSDFVFAATRQAAGVNPDGILGGRKLEALMRRGGSELLQPGPGGSNYGPQTANTHGGLLFSRSPTRFWHASPGMLRDVDLSGCYNTVISSLHIYWGRPVLLEPGRAEMKLAEAVQFVQQHADPDAWLIRVSGPIEGYLNALIPSTEEAITSSNYRSKRRDKRKTATLRALERERLDDPGSFIQKGSSRLYSNMIESGIVTAATWQVIQLLPPRVREQYEHLTADTIMLYPRILVAGTVPEYDALVQRLQTEQLPWETTLDLEKLELVQRTFLDADYVSLRFPICDYAERIGEFRKEAKQKYGKGSGLELAWKQQANAMYGVLASPHFCTQNVMAANQITAQARALAFLLSQTLNAVQIITDGCTYRKDQIPSCTYEQCLQIQADYPIRRGEAEDWLSFHSPREVPDDDAAFTSWLRDHCAFFFQATPQAISELFGKHKLEHKLTSKTGKTAFDALGCDGAGNYLKCVQAEEGNWLVTDIAARSYGRASKEILKDFLVKVYSQDLLEQIPPTTEDHVLLGLREAYQKAKQALEQGVEEVYLPLGLKSSRFLNYKLIKLSAFLFQTPKQRAKVLKQVERFEIETSCGLELLTFRRTYRDRKEGSLRDMAELLYKLIQEGRTQLAGLLNFHKMPANFQTWSEQRKVALRSAKDRAEATFLNQIDCDHLDEFCLITGITLTDKDEGFIEVR